MIFTKSSPLGILEFRIILIVCVVTDKLIDFAVPVACKVLDPEAKKIRRRIKDVVIILLNL